MAGQGAVIAIHIGPLALRRCSQLLMHKSWSAKGWRAIAITVNSVRILIKRDQPRDVTLIEIEAIEGLKRDYEVELERRPVQTKYYNPGHRAKSSCRTRISHW